MNGKLYGAMFKANARTISSFAVGSALYLWLMIWVYPSFSKAHGINELIKSMPEGMLRAFGFSRGIQDLAGFMSGEFYGLLFLIILSIYSVMITTKLIARLVDRGSMAFLLSSPTSRVQIALTQATVVISGLVMITLVTILGGFTGTAWLVDGVKLDTANFIHLNVMGFLLFFVISGYSFMFSCLFDDEKRALSTSATVTLLFYVLDLVGKMSDKLDFLRNFSIFSLFKAQDIAYGSEHLLWKGIGLAVSGVILFMLGIIIFRKRDLSI
jgi:ABC-2 type transport system permease protein